MQQVLTNVNIALKMINDYVIVRYHYNYKIYLMSKIFLTTTLYLKKKKSIVSVLNTHLFFEHKSKLTSFSCFFLNFSIMCF